MLRKMMRNAAENKKIQKIYKDIGCVVTVFIIHDSLINKNQTRRNKRYNVKFNLNQTNLLGNMTNH